MDENGDSESGILVSSMLRNGSEAPPVLSGLCSEVFISSVCCDITAGGVEQRNDIEVSMTCKDHNTSDALATLMSREESKCCEESTSVISGKTADVESGTVKSSYFQSVQNDESKDYDESSNISKNSVSVDKISKTDASLENLNTSAVDDDVKMVLVDSVKISCKTEESCEEKEVSKDSECNKDEKKDADMISSSGNITTDFKKPFDLTKLPDSQQSSTYKADAKPKTSSSTTDSFRPLARLLHDLGQELVRQQVYRDLIDIQLAKEEKNKLDEKEKSQLVKLTEGYSKLLAKNSTYQVPGRTCRCNFFATSMNGMALHQEYGASSENFPFECCVCDEFHSKWPSHFSNHMDAVHRKQSRLLKKVIPTVCFYCPFENKSQTKLDLHMSRCTKKFTLSLNLQPLPPDCDIPIISKPTSTPKSLISSPFRSPNAPMPSVSSKSSSMQSPLSNVGQPSLMEIGGQLYSLVNHNGKALFTSLRSQINGASPGAMIVNSSKTDLKHSHETCEICGIEVSDRDSLWNHFRVEHKIELGRMNIMEQEPWMTCQVCKIKFWTYQGLARHSKLVHMEVLTKTILSPCYLCGTVQPSNPLNHLSSGHNITLLDMYQNKHCCICNRRLKNTRTFEDHMVMAHRDIFANHDVLRTVIQALSTAYQLKIKESSMPLDLSAKPNAFKNDISPAGSNSFAPQNVQPRASMKSVKSSIPQSVNSLTSSAQFSSASEKSTTPKSDATEYRSSKLENAAKFMPSTTNITKTPEKSAEDIEKELNKIYKDYADLGRPILRSMRNKLADNSSTSSTDKCLTDAAGNGKVHGADKRKMTKTSKDKAAVGDVEPTAKKSRLKVNHLVELKPQNDCLVKNDAINT